MKPRALLSVYDKRGIVEFGRRLVELGYELVSTGNTHKALTGAGVPATYVSQATGFPEILEGRVKTLHPAVHGGLLARRDRPEHLAQIAELGIAPIDVVAVNLYPFAQTVAKPGVTEEEALENIDIGGPSMIRAAAKNYPHVYVVVEPERYDAVSAALAAGGDQRALRRALAHAAFRHTAQYDAAIDAYFGRAAAGAQAEAATTVAADEADEAAWPERLALRFHKRQALRYGENPHQSAAFYAEDDSEPLALANAEQLGGKELSYNNIVDAAAAVEMAAAFAEPVAVAVKHTNPCGLAIGATPGEAYQKAYEADPTSIFGGIVAFNRPLDPNTAAKLVEIFLEIVIAPDFAPGTREVLQQKKNLRVLRLPALDTARHGVGLRPGLDFKRVPGGLLAQQFDRLPIDQSEFKVMSRRPPTEGEWRDLLFAWNVVRFVKSNAIVVAKSGQTLGVGAGQMNRILPAKLALEQAGARARGAVMASEALIPFGDVVAACAKAGVRALIETGGAIRDQETIEGADARDIALVFTGRRHFRH
ncbi:MAG TPA: bifunctional phosphoribosylaminoimidazolecarboxamide formyltransferase/IMP cyclohydrolase [Limnochordia bacterium]|nr:bifunctional phosphoribosylaminoimidazolecarboxamide formyltransferase/IMP cyclohydrolase [Limnochordia bacterium]